MVSKAVSDILQVHLCIFTILSTSVLNQKKYVWTAFLALGLKSIVIHVSLPSSLPLTCETEYLTAFKHQHSHLQILSGKLLESSSMGSSLGYVGMRFSIPKSKLQISIFNAA